MSRQENRHSRPGMDLVRDEVSYGVRISSLSICCLSQVKEKIKREICFLMQLSDEIQQLEAEKRALQDKAKQTK